MKPHAPRRRRRSGFTLLELGIVIGVAAILAAAILPDLIETMRNRMAERAAADAALIHDAARLYFVQATHPLYGRYRWPGEQTAGQCATGYLEGNALFELTNGGYIASGGGPANPTNQGPNFMRNPWGQRYYLSLYAPSTTPAPACLFGVVTDVPEVVANAFISFLPQAACNPPGQANGACTIVGQGGAAPAVPAGFQRCCSYVPKPGAAFGGPCPAGQQVEVRNGHLVCCPGNPGC